MTHCIFCRIATHEAPAQIIWEDDEVLVFHDIAPQAPVHILIIPKEHLEKLDEMQTDHQHLLGKMLFIAKEQAATLGLKNKGYRLVINTGREGGQAVYHLHMHILGGRPLRWPPG